MKKLLSVLIIIILLLAAFSVWVFYKLISGPTSVQELSKNASALKAGLKDIEKATNENLKTKQSPARLRLAEIICSEDSCHTNAQLNAKIKGIEFNIANISNITLNLQNRFDTANLNTKEVCERFIENNSNVSLKISGFKFNKFVALLSSAKKDYLDEFIEHNPNANAEFKLSPLNGAVQVGLYLNGDEFDSKLYFLIGCADGKQTKGKFSDDVFSSLINGDFKEFNNDFYIDPKLLNHQKADLESAIKSYTSDYHLDERQQEVLKRFFSTFGKSGSWHINAKAQDDNVMLWLNDEFFSDLKSLKNERISQPIK